MEAGIVIVVLACALLYSLRTCRNVLRLNDQCLATCRELEATNTALVQQNEQLVELLEFERALALNAKGEQA